MTSLKWTEYNGLESTLPPAGESVLVFLKEPLEYDQLIVGGHAFDKKWNFINGKCHIHKGDKWLPIPTEEQCEAVQEAVEHLKLIEDGTTSNGPRAEARLALSRLDIEVPKRNGHYEF